MIRSMTGFGRAEFELSGKVFEVEVRSVNHRHLDSRVKLPRQMSDQEAPIKALIQGRLQRGKVDLTVAAAGGAVSAGKLQVDHEVAGEYVAAADQLAESHNVMGVLDMETLITLPGVTRFVEEGMDPEELARVLAKGVNDALDRLCEMRAAEGATLAAEFESRLRRVEELVGFFEERAGVVVEAAKDRLRKRTDQIQQETGLLDEARLYQEIVIAVDRLDIGEELARLRSHVEQFRIIVGEGGEKVSVGRRLDFLLQELGREANTVGSKANDASLAHNVVELKAELERIREQAQNVE